MDNNGLHSTYLSVYNKSIRPASQTNSNFKGEFKGEGELSCFSFANKHK